MLNRFFVFAYVLFVSCAPDPMSPAQALLPVCERVLAERLVAPATYQRVSVADVSKPIDTAGMVEVLERRLEALDIKASAGELVASERLERAEGMLALIALRFPERAAGPPTLFVLLIDYDSQNAMGVPLRGAAHCEYQALDGDVERGSHNNVRVNGQTSLDWILAQKP